jgi:hypothetical protein
VRTGLASALTPSALPNSYLHTIGPEHASTFAHTTGLSIAEVADLTMVSMADRYPPLALAYCGRNRTTNGIFVKENWIFSRASRYCPDCLAGDNGTIQRQHGGAWKRSWRLPIVFACLVHRRPLLHTCPT